MAIRSRRTQLIALLASLALIYMIFFSSESSSTDFRRTTENALARKHGVLRGELSDEDLTAQTNAKLQEVLANRRPDDSQEKIILEGSRTAKPTSQPYANDLGGTDEKEIPVAGRKTMPRPSPFQSAYVDHQKPKYPMRDDEEVAFNGAKVETATDPGEHMAREELERILKRSPIIIFSKSYCPSSKKAKKLLLEQYTITPAPFVVELDLMTELVPKKVHESKDEDEDEEEAQVTLGRKVQDLLLTLTGRRTVPNIMINAQSLGGGDDVARMDGDGTLVDMIKKMGGKRIVGVDRVDEDEKKGKEYKKT
jgi:glutaredoxin